MADGSSEDKPMVSDSKVAGFSDEAQTESKNLQGVVIESSEAQDNLDQQPSSLSEESVAQSCGSEPIHEQAAGHISATENCASSHVSPYNLKNLRKEEVSDGARVMISAGQMNENKKNIVGQTKVEMRIPLETMKSIGAQSSFAGVKPEHGLIVEEQQSLNQKEATS